MVGPGQTAAVGLSARARACVYEYVCVSKYVCLKDAGIAMCMHVCMCARTRLCVRMRVCMGVDMHVQGRGKRTSAASAMLAA